LPPDHKSALLRWFDALLVPRTVSIEDPLPATRPPTLIVDSSATGWGGILLDKDVMTHAAGKFSSPIPSSVEAEPEGMFEAAKSLLDTTLTTRRRRRRRTRSRSRRRRRGTTASTGPVHVAGHYRLNVF